MNCQKCGLPQDTGALGSVLPQCICHWKHSPVTEYEFNIDRLTKLVKQIQAEMGCYKIELELHKAMIQDLEKVIKIKERDYNFMKDLAIGEEARAKELEKLLGHSVGADCREMRYIQEIENKDAKIAELQKDLKYFTDPCSPACKPSICDCYQARFAINNRKGTR